MTTTTQKLAVVYFPSLNRDDIDTFRKKYDPKWEMIPLHITIVYPFADIPEDQLVEHIEKITKEVRSFSIELNGLTKSFDHCLFLLVKRGNEEINNLHDKLYSGILQPYRQSDPPFTPHVTIGYFGDENDELKKELYEKAFAEAEGMHIDLTCNFDTITLIKGDGVTPAKVIETFRLT